MKRSSRAINIFSMSALDLFASALGAFILIAIVLFPYFPTIGNLPDDVTTLQAEMAGARQELQTCEADLTQAREEAQAAQEALQEAEAELTQTREESQAAQEAGVELQQCIEALKKKFLLVVISWNSQDDVDLHVIDPQGNEFYYAQRGYPNTEAKLEEDNIHGPGNEIWLHPRATSGQYRIYYKLFRQRTVSVRVRGAILTPNGRQSIPNHDMRMANEKRLVAIVTVDNNGEATLRVQ